MKNGEIDAEPNIEILHPERLFFSLADGLIYGYVSNLVKLDLDLDLVDNLQGPYGANRK